MGWLQSLIYSLVVGFTEIVPVSSFAHDTVLRRLFGAEPQPLLRLFLHLSILIAVIVSCRKHISQINRERRLLRMPKKRRTRQPDFRQLMDFSLLKMAAFAMLPIVYVYFKASAWYGNLSILSIFLVVNGIILFVPSLLPSANKESGGLSRLDGLLLGLCSALSAFHGISRIATVTSVATMRGADRQYAVRLALLLSIPALVFILAFDIYEIVLLGLGTVTFLAIIQFVVSAIVAFIGARLGILLIRFMAVNVGFTGLAYYSWGLAMFSLILYLTS